MRTPKTGGTDAPSFAAYLLKTGKITADALTRAEQVSRESGEKFELVLTRLGIITERERTEALADFLSLPIATAKDFPTALIYADRLSAKFLRESHFRPFEDREDGIAVAFANPLDSYAIDAIRFAVDKLVIPYVAYPADLEAAYRQLYNEDRTEAGRLAEAASSQAGSGFVDDVDRLKDMASDAPVIRLVN